jgi:anti-repressor protein
MNELVFNGANGQALTNSLLVAEKFGKEHRNVMRDIRNLTSNKDLLNFEQIFIETQQPDSYGRMQDMFVMNRDGFSLLVMGFNGAKALNFKMEFLAAFNKMESMLNSDDYILARSQEILRTRLQDAQYKLVEAEKKALVLQSQNEVQAERLEANDRTIKFLQPGATFAKAVQTSDTSILVGDLARIIKQNGVEIGQNRLFTWLRVHDYLIRRSGESYNLPTQKALSLGLFEIKKTVITKPDGTSLVTTTPKVTGKGQVYFVNKFLYIEANRKGAELSRIENEKKGGAQ